MSVPDGLFSLIGEWTAVNRLWLSPQEPVRESDATASVARVAQGNFLTIRYAWADGGRPQDGLLVLGRVADSDDANAAWIDSWHMADKIMSLRGKVGDAGEVSLVGSYAAPPGPDWGWRIDLEPGAGDSFRLVMYNVTPDGQEHLAVEAAFSRAR